MIPKRSWATLVPEFVYENLRDVPDTSTIEIPLANWAGNNPLPGDMIYLIKPKTTDEYQDAGVFCASILIKYESGFANLRLDKNLRTDKKAVLTQKNTHYIRFESLNLKDRYLRSIHENADKVGSAYYLDNRNSVRLETLFCKIKVTFTSLDAKISLLAYEESLAAGISPESSALTVKAAIECGRLVSSISTKMSNYRHLDPRVEGGFKNGAKIDKTTWTEYFVPELKKVDTLRLRQDIANESKYDEFAFVIEENSEPVNESNIPNDENTRQAYNRRVRNGQSRFRKTLITLYDSRCAFTKTNEETVLEACHIISHAKTGDNSLDNGLLLRSDIHVLFDEHLVTLANDGITVCVRQDVTAPEYTKLNNSVAQTRPSISERYLNLIRQRNSEIQWVK